MKAKKSPKKVKKLAFDPLSSSKAIISLLIVLLAASLFLLFQRYQASIIANNSFYLFMSLTVICMGLFVALLFLMNPSASRKK